MKIWERPETRMVLTMLVSLVLTAQGWMMWKHHHDNQHPVEVAQCLAPKAGCDLRVGSEIANIRMSQVPAILRPFTVTVTGLHHPATINMTMAGMEMGPLEFPLKSSVDGSQSATVTLPFCVQGRRDWRLRLRSGDASAELAFYSAS